jgi:hypothetical protein
VNEGQDTPPVFEYLKSLLDADVTTEGENATVTVGALQIAIAPLATGNGYNVQSFVGDEKVMENDFRSVGDLIKWLFSAVNNGNERLKQFSPAEDNEDEESATTPSDFYESLKRMAEESGESSKILRNRSLVDLRQGLVVSDSPLAPATGSKGDQDVDAFISTIEQKKPMVRAEKMKNGHPVRLFENKTTADASKPYSTMNEWSLIDLGFPHGVQLVRKSDLPPSKKLVFDPAKGVVLGDSNAPTNHKNMWKFRGWGK